MQCWLTFVDESLRDDEMMSKTRRKVDVHNAAAVIISAPAERQTTTEIQTRYCVVVMSMQRRSHVLKHEGHHFFSFRFFLSSFPSPFLSFLFFPSSRWLCGVVVRAPDSRSADRGFDSRLRHCRATTLVKLFTPMCLCPPSSISWHLAMAFMSTRRMWQPWHEAELEPGDGSPGQWFFPGRVRPRVKVIYLQTRYCDSVSVSMLGTHERVALCKVRAQWTHVSKTFQVSQ